MPGRKKCGELDAQDDTTDEQKKALSEGLSKLGKSIPEVKSYVFGPDAGLDPERNHHFCLAADFASTDDYLVYAKHPEHVKLIEDLIKPILAPGGRAAVQYKMS